MFFFLSLHGLHEKIRSKNTVAQHFHKTTVSASRFSVREAFIIHYFINIYSFKHSTSPELAGAISLLYVSAREISRPAPIVSSLYFLQLADNLR